MDMLMHVGKFYDTGSYHRNRLIVQSRIFCKFSDPTNCMNSILKNKYTQKIIDFDRFKMPITLKIYLFCVKKEQNLTFDLNIHKYANEVIYANDEITVAHHFNFDLTPNLLLSNEN